MSFFHVKTKCCGGDNNLSYLLLINEHAINKLSSHTQKKLFFVAITTTILMNRHSQCKWWVKVINFFPTLTSLRIFIMSQLYSVNNLLTILMLLLFLLHHYYFRQIIMHKSAPQSGINDHRDLKKSKPHLHEAFFSRGGLTIIKSAAV